MRGIVRVTADSLLTIYGTFVVLLVVVSEWRWCLMSTTILVVISLTVLVVKVIYPVRFTIPVYRVVILDGVAGEGPSKLVITLSKF